MFGELTGQTTCWQPLHDMDFRPELIVLETSMNDCQAPQRPLDEVHFKVEPTDINLTERVALTEHRSPKRREDHHGTRWLESGFHGKRHCAHHTQTS